MTFRLKQRCEGCWETPAESLDPHHLLSRGGGRMDVTFNLCALCRECHTKVHDGKALRFGDPWDIVAARERRPKADIIRAIEFLRQLPDGIHFERAEHILQREPITVQSIVYSLLRRLLT
jgi:hypothetical protein